MECDFSEEHAKLLLSKEWLVKVDTNQSSNPYLFKFYSSSSDLTCHLLVTDTRGTWGEVLNGKQLSRRWRNCNVGRSPVFVESEDEDTWRTSTLGLLSKAHTLGGITDLSFEVVESKYADFAFELECDSFKWRWETCFLGHKFSAEILSKHLIMPLISVSHLAFSSIEPVNEITENELEKAIDKLGRTARRTVDTHVKHAVSKPRFASSLSRMTAMFNFVSELPKVFSTAEKPELNVPIERPRAHSPIPIKSRPISPPSNPNSHQEIDAKPSVPAPSPGNGKPQQSDGNANSATESDTEDLPFPSKGKARASMHLGSPSTGHRNSVPPLRDASPLPSVPQGIDPKKTETDSDSSPRLVKKPRPRASSDDDSEADRKKRVSQLKNGALAGVKRGARQPIKRGGKRF